MPDFQTCYALMTTGQAPVSVVAEWLRMPLFAAYVARRRGR